MNAKKFYFVLIGLFVVSVIGVFVGIYLSTMLMKNSSNKLIQTKLTNIGYDIEEQTYLQARKNLEKYKDLNDAILKVLPKDKDQARAVKELYQIGDETGIIVDNIQFPTSTLGQKKPSSSQATSSESSASSSSVTQAKPVASMPGVLGIDINISLQPSTGKNITYDNMIKFLQKVELNRRSMQIKNITVNSDIQDGGITFDLTLTIFVKP